MRRLLVLLAALVAPVAAANAERLAAPAAAATVAATHAKRLRGTPVPQGFVGVDVGGPMFDPNDDIDIASEFSKMVANGVEDVRVVFNWSLAQPYQRPSQVPTAEQGEFTTIGGVPTSFAGTDELVGLAAARGLTILPTVLYAPGWDAGRNRSGGIAPPAQPGPYAAYLSALIGRYGPSGSFWSANPGLPRDPIRAWQIWNEPNLSAYWPQPFARSYVSLLSAAHAAIKRADPGATVVLGAITNLAWKYIGQIYKVPGASHDFDVIAVNGFTSTPHNVLLFLKFVRRAINRNGGKHTPLLATELSWPSARGKAVRQADWDTTEAGQARKIAALLPLLAAHRRGLRLAGFDYFTWIGKERIGASDDFDFAGLERYTASGNVVAKPALAAFKRAALAIEGCRRKGSRATICIR